MRARLAWVLNLDAEHELAAGRRYAPSRHVSALVARERQRLVGALVGPDDVVVTEESVAAGARPAEGRLGLAWCPTPRALALLERAGARVPPAPDLAVLRRVNARPFAAFLREGLRGDSFGKHVAHDLAQALTLLSVPAPDGWLVRRTFGAAGRGRRRIAAGRPDAAERAWLAASLRGGPVTVEPWVRVVREHTRSAWVDATGVVTVSRPCVQATTAQGAWIETAPTDRGALSAADDERLEHAVRTAGAALAAAGYHGAFGIDAYHHRAEDGHGVVLNPLSEINARFTMDWATGMEAPPPVAVE